MMTNLQTGHRRNISEIRMNSSTTSTAFAALLAATLSTGAAFGQDSTDVTVEMFGNATLYVASTEASVDAELIEVGDVEGLIYDDAGEMTAVLVDIGPLYETEARAVAVDIDRLYPIGEDGEEDSFDFRVDDTMEGLSQYVPYSGAFVVPERIARTADVEVQGTGLTTQSGAGNVTSETIGKDLTDAREPIGGDFDVQEEIVEPDILLNDD